MTDLSAMLSDVVAGAYLTPTQLPLQPDLSLYLLNADYPQDRLDSEQAQRLMDAPPYWSFCWASGQVLAHQFMQHPEMVRDRIVVDFGCGSGVVAIAAAKAGAARAIACDCDELALQATLANAKLNQVEIETSLDLADVSALLGEAQGEAVLCAADVFYDRDNIPLLEEFQQNYAEVLLADSRLAGRALPNMEIYQRFVCSTLPDLDESKEFNSVSLYRTA